MFSTSSRKELQQEEEGKSLGISPIAALGGNNAGGSNAGGNNAGGSTGGGSVWGTAEAVILDLPELGMEFKGRKQFLDEVIATLSDLQKVCSKVLFCCCVYLSCE